MVAQSNVPGTIARSAWGARFPDGFGDRPLPVTEWWLHHSVTKAPDLLPPFTDDDAAIRLLESIGQSRFGGGISYTIPITPVGRSYVGHSFWRRGAHTLGHNTVAAAICFVGDYDKANPTGEMLEEAARVMAAAHKAGLATRHTLNGGHRDVYATDCPGDKAYAAIATINAKANQLYLHDGPPVPPTPAKLDVDGIYGPATVSRMQAWLKTPVDGVVDGQVRTLLDASPGLRVLANWRWTAAAAGSPMVRADQVRLSRLGLYHGSADGLVGPLYWRAVQAEQHTVIDGVVSYPSLMVAALQKDLNSL